MARICIKDLIVIWELVEAWNWFFIHRKQDKITSFLFHIRLSYSSWREGESCCICCTMNPAQPVPLRIMKSLSDQPASHSALSHCPISPPAGTSQEQLTQAQLFYRSSCSRRVLDRTAGYCWLCWLDWLICNLKWGLRCCSGAGVGWESIYWTMFR